MRLIDYVDYFYLLKDNLFTEDVSKEELEGYLKECGSISFFTNDNTYQNIAVIPDIFGCKFLVVVDEVELETELYELDACSPTFLDEVKSRYSKVGCLNRLKYEESGMYWADANRVTSALSGDFTEIINTLGNAKIVVVTKRDVTRSFDYHVLSILACIAGHQVYYVYKVDDEPKENFYHHFDLYRYMSDVISSQNTPYYIRLAIGQMNRNGNGLIVKGFGSVDKRYRRIIPCVVKEEPSDIDLICYRLSDVSKLLSIKTDSDKFASSLSIMVEASRDTLGIELAPYVVRHTGKGFRKLKFIDAVTGLIDNNNLYKTVIRDLEPYLSWKYEKYVVGNKQTNKVKVNNFEPLLRRDKVEECLRYEILQQYCNILSELYYKSEKSVRLQDIAIFEVDGDIRLCVETRPFNVVRNMELIVTYETPDGSTREKRTLLTNDSTPVVYINAPLFNLDNNWEPMSDYGKSIMVKALFTHLTRHTNIDEQPRNASALTNFMEQGDDTFNTSDNTFVGQDKRRLLWYYSKPLSDSMTVKDYMFIPRSFREPAINIFGEIGLNTRRVGNNIILRLR